jgi:hypothetical protein
MNATPDAVFSKMEEEHRMNRFLAAENVPKQISDLEAKHKGLQDILAKGTITEEEMKNMESEIQSLNEVNVQLTEQRLKMR